uniref:Uncharacterized protein n=1 Tax=Anguilla anguilla TaxID=7936 RepID=A0A0E9UAU4_ANGAN
MSGTLSEAIIAKGQVDCNEEKPPST